MIDLTTPARLRIVSFHSPFYFFWQNITCGAITFKYTYNHTTRELSSSPSPFQRTRISHVKFKAEVAGNLRYLGGRHSVGKVRIVLVKRLAKELVDRYPEEFSTDFEKNKILVSELLLNASKRLRNRIAGYITHLMRLRQPKYQENL